MATRRMFSKELIKSDKFVFMSLSAQGLYFHLCLEADDDGFVQNPKSIQRLIGANDDDFTELIKNKFVIIFDNGIIVIKHWKVHNSIPTDRYHSTICKVEKEKLIENNDKTYSVKNDGVPVVNNLETNCIQDVNNLETQTRLDKTRLDKTRLDSHSQCEVSQNETFAQINSSSDIPTPFEIFNFYHKKKLSISPIRLWKYNKIKNWEDKDGNKIKNWQKSYLTMCETSSPDEVYNPELEFNPNDYE